MYLFIYWIKYVNIMIVQKKYIYVFIIYLFIQSFIIFGVKYVNIMIVQNNYIKKYIYIYLFGWSILIMI